MHRRLLGRLLREIGWLRLALRHYAARRFGTLEADLLDSLHYEKCGLLAGLV